MCIDRFLLVFFTRVPQLRWQLWRAKHRCASMAGFNSFKNAAIMIAGIELAHRIHKGQFSFGRGRRRRGWPLKAEWATALA